MKIAISATNPCHMYPLALELARAGALDCYYSGYPEWKLPESREAPVRAHTFRTNVVYGALKFFPGWAHKRSRQLFLWQDHGFDRWVGRVLAKCDFVHAMPGQALETFRRARKLGVATVLNHATGPVQSWVRIMRPEYERVGLLLEDVCVYDSRYFEREQEEYALSDFHCAASTIVRDELIRMGIPPGRILLVPYGAERAVFFPAEKPSLPDRFRVVFAGQAGVRKGIRCLSDAFLSAAGPDWELHFYGPVLPEVDGDIAALRSDSRVTFHGPVSQARLAEAFRGGSVLVLPSLEEGYGLVVPQALSTGLPCILSDRVGAKDLLREGENGSVFPVESSVALAEKLRWWSNRGRCQPEELPWSRSAATLLSESQRVGTG